MSSLSVHSTAPAPLSLPEALSRRHQSVLTIAHRGVWTTAPENSLGAIEAAIALGVEMVEIDTQSTSDGALVVIHDETLDRTTTGQGSVGRTAYRDIRALRLREAAGGPEARVTEETLPLLTVALETARDRVLVNIDTKYERDLPRVAALVLDMGMADQVIIKTDIDPDADRHLIEDLGLLGKIVHMPMLRAHPGRFATDLAAIARLKPPMAEVKFSSLADLEAGRSELERQDIRLWVNSLDVSHCLDFNDTRAAVDPDGVWGSLLSVGVGAIQTDSAAALKTWLAAR